jgi:hypothetical protein
VNATVLPTRWTQLRPHLAGEAYSNSPHRFNTVAAGRRSGKTERFKRKLILRAMGASTTWEPRFFAGAPTRDQAKRIFWDDLKALTPRWLLAERPSESELKIRLINGAEVWVVGLDKPERIEGSPWDGGGITEFGNVHPQAWPMNIRPALSDRNGWCDLEGVPEGRNHYYLVDLRARAMMKEFGAASEWGAFGWPSKEVLPASEIDAMRADMDELTFEQEANASFISFEGRAYYSFTEAEHCAPLKYDPKQVLALCFDFNVEPGVCAIVQEQLLPKQYEHATVKKEDGTLLSAARLDKPIVGTGVIGEVHIPRNSNTPAVCRRIVKDWGKHVGPVRCYGDATGGARGTAQTQGSDWDLIRTELKPVFAERLDFRVKTANPRERSRINAVNSRIKSSSGNIRLMVDGVKAPNVVKDFEGVPLLKGGSGEIDKKHAPLLSHVSDAIGYYLDYEYPVADDRARRVQIGGV